jgi:ATP-dependent Lon protease
VLNRLNLPGGTIQATIQGLIRIHLEGIRYEHGYYTAYPRLVEELPADPAEAELLIERILTTLNGIGAKIERLADVPRILRRNTGDPGRFADLVATLAHFPVHEKDAVLQRLDIADRLRYVHERLHAEWIRIRSIENDEPQRAAAAGAAASQSGDGEGARVVRTVVDRSAEVRRQISALQAELGEIDPAEKEAITLLRQIEQAQLPTRVASIARREVERLRVALPTSSEATEIRTYLDTLLEFPWDRSSESGPIELEAVRTALDEKHLGLAEVKQRILEIISVAMLRGNVTGLVPCIVGPPGVGKRSLAAAVARGLGRPLVGVELGGRGETQLVGTSRTRPGGKPGKLISAFRDPLVNDPVYLLEEIDDIGIGKVEGDPIEALEEFLDPENRSAFVDRYLEVPVRHVGHHLHRHGERLQPDPPLHPRLPHRDPHRGVHAGGEGRDRPSTAPAAAHPRARAGPSRGGDGRGDAPLPHPRLRARRGAWEPARYLSAILRYVAHAKATGGQERWTLTAETVEEVLGIPRYATTVAESAPEVGVVTGLAWTASGGELMFIEALKMPGTGRLIITGLLGDVMRESVNAAYSYVRSRADLLGIPNSSFGNHDLHIHFPVGATPKDGPSAGAAVTLAIASSLSDRPVRHDLGMTGEVTLRGKILDIGGVREKTLAAYRAGIRQIILPTGNERDLRDVPEDIRKGMTFHFADHMDEIFEIALMARASAGRGAVGADRARATGGRAPRPRRGAGGRRRGGSGGLRGRRVPYGWGRAAQRGPPPHLVPPARASGVGRGVRRADRPDLELVVHAARYELLPLGARHEGGGGKVAGDVHRRTDHVEDAIHAEDEGDPGGRLPAETRPTGGRG